MNKMKKIRVYGVISRCGSAEKIRFVETEENISFNSKRAAELLADQGVIVDEILQITELNERTVYEVSK
jgi:hypothetical protein